MNEYPKCEICGYDARVIICDLLQGDPDGEWPTFSIHGPPHPFCWAHERESKMFDKHGNELTPKKDRLLVQLIKLARETDHEMAHIQADDLLCGHIGDDEITEAFKAVARYCA